MRLEMNVKPRQLWTSCCLKTAPETSRESIVGCANVVETSQRTKMAINSVVNQILIGSYFQHTHA